jgi:hypothetical protein
VVSDLVELRVIAPSEVAAQAVARLAELVAIDRQTGPYPSRKTPGLVMYYLTGRLHPAAAAAPPRGRRRAELPGRAR